MVGTEGRDGGQPAEHMIHCLSLPQLQSHLAAASRDNQARLDQQDGGARLSPEAQPQHAAAALLTRRHADDRALDKGGEHLDSQAVEVRCSLQRRQTAGLIVCRFDPRSRAASERYCYLLWSGW